MTDYPADPSERTAPSDSIANETALLASAPLGSDPNAWLASHIYCGANDQNYNGVDWDSTMHWYLNTDSIPSGINVDNTITNVRGARITWEDNVTWCSSIGDSSGMNFTYEGPGSWSYGSNDHSTVGWGDMSTTGCSADAAGCSRKDLICGPGYCHIVEADIRLNKDDDWINGQSSCCYDIKSVVVHETGHNIGFGHVSETSPNVMCHPCQRHNDVSGRKLGKGDANLNNSIY